jgi:hypothetical protein
MASAPRIVVVISALLPLLVWLPSDAQNCRDMPTELTRKKCVEEKHPEAFQKCKDIPFGPALKQCMRQNTTTDAKKPPDSLRGKAAAAHSCSERKAICYQGMVRVSKGTTLGAKQTSGGDPCERSFQSCMQDGTWYAEYTGESTSGLERK